MREKTNDDLLQDALTLATMLAIKCRPVDADNVRRSAVTFHQRGDRTMLERAVSTARLILDGKSSSD